MSTEYSCNNVVMTISHGSDRHGDCRMVRSLNTFFFRISHFLNVTAPTSYFFEVQ